MFRFAYTFFASGRGTSFRRLAQLIETAVNWCSMSMSEQNHSNGNEDTVRSLVSIVQNAVRRNAAIDPASDVEFSSLLSTTRSALRRRSRRNVPGKHGLLVSITCAFWHEHIVHCQ